MRSRGACLFYAPEARRTMRRLVIPVLALLLAAGCVTGPTDGDGEGGDGAGRADGYALACDGLSTTASWGEPCLAFASPNDSPSKTEIDLAVDPLDPAHVVVGAKDLDPAASDCVWAVAQVTQDAGASWKTSIIGGEQAGRAPTNPLFGWQCITDPIMVFDDEGVLYYSLQLYDHTVEGGDLPGPLAGLATVGSEIVLARSNDGGLTWDKFTTLHAGDGTSVFHDYMRMAWNPETGSVYTIWNQFTQPATVVPVLVASRDGGESAAAPVYIPVPEKAAEGVIMSGLAVASDGTVYVMLNDGRDAFFTKSVDDARTFSTPVKVGTHEPVPRMMKNNSYRSGSGFELAVDASGGERDGCLYATFADYVDEDADINVMSSCDGGDTWSEPVQVNTGAFARGDQWMERPVVDRKGTLHLVYVDKSRDPANVGMDVTWARSTDGGLTWTLEYLTTRTFDPNLGVHQDGFPFMGDYLGIGTAGDWLYMGFPTTVTGRAEVAVAKVRIP